MMFAGLLMTTGFTACNGDDTESASQEQTLMGQFMKIPYEPASSEDIPEWLMSKVMSGDRLPFMPIEVYQFEWNGGIWYYIHNPLNSCLLCDIYDRDGNNVDQYEVASKDEMIENSTNWKFILCR